jgi:metal-sulfur cluster biosynthetic enzyme
MPKMKKNSEDKHKSAKKAGHASTVQPQLSPGEAYHIPTEGPIVEALKKVVDPEIGIDVYTLGLIYDVRQDGASVQIKMTLTTPMCPYGPMLVDNVKAEIGSVKGVGRVEVELVFDPPWIPSEELRAMLGV